MGNVKYGSTPKYWDYESLLVYLKDQAAHHPFTDTKSIIQAGTNSYVELAEVDSQTVADIGKAEVTLQLTAAGDDASHNTVVFTLTYIDGDGESHTTTATGTAGLNATPVNFNPAANDVYAVTAFSASADFDNHNVTATVAAGATFATITATGVVTAATEAQLYGVGSIAFKSAADNAGDREKDAYLTYLNNHYELKYAICTTAAAASTAVRWYEATYADGVYTATTTSVKDFYRVRELRFEVAATGRMLIYDMGGATTIYGVIKATYWEAQLTRFYVQKDYTAWFVDFKASLSTTADAKLKITRTDKGDSLASDCIIELPKDFQFDCIMMMHLADLSELKFAVIGNTAEITAAFRVVEIKDGKKIIGGDL